MRTVGVVVEYNPFHNGHRYHIEQSKKITDAEVVIAVMSGYFLQRGEPALVSKWTRTEMALYGGADLVLEIPTVYACQSAEWFAFGAVALLEATGVVDALSFGSESGDVTWMNDVAATLAREPLPFRERLQGYLRRGWHYPRAYGQALHDFHPDASPELSKPNNILGLNYLSALKKLNSNIVPYTVQREKADYHETKPSDSAIASATAIRHTWLETGMVDTIRPYVPPSTYHLLEQAVRQGMEPITWETFHQALFGKLMTTSSEALRRIYEMEEGLEYRLHQRLAEATSVNAYLTAVKTKRYTWNRLQRILTYLLLGLTKRDIAALNLANGPSYIRVLGFSDRGRTLLKQMKKTTSLPIVTRIRRDQPPMLQWDIRASRLYALGSKWQEPFASEFVRKPVYLSDVGATGSCSK